jgi:hypothetical protein
VGNMKRVSEMKKTLTIGIILTLFSTPSFAQSGGGDMFTSFLPLILICAVMFFIFRKVNKSKKIKEKKEKEILDDIESRLKNLENEKDSL